ncbi:MAG TPA: SAM-dependent methyltransferase [Polyangia bacterium]|nr:SAM-dependent methyltransferase [Polyangia bacterium]
MAEPLVQHVSDTAFLVANARAVETERPAPLFRDPLAARLAGEKGRAIGAAFPAMTGWTVVIRTVIIDAFVAEAIAGGVDLVVNLGAGLDTRPYRLELPQALQWIEVDYPDVIAFKEQRLASETPHCRLERVGLDLTAGADRRALFAKLAARANRMLVLTEGVVPYLDEAQVADLADDLRAVPQVASWIVDYLSPESHKYRQRMKVTRQLTQAPFKFRPPDWFGFFARHGWCAKEIRYLVDEGKRLGRRPLLPLMTRLLLATLLRFAPPEKRDAFRKFAAYVVLEPAPRNA